MYFKVLFMSEKEKQLEALQDIRNLMRESSKFISLSGLSGVFAGVYALAGAYAGKNTLELFQETNLLSYDEMIMLLLGICMTVLSLSIATALLFSLGKARKNGIKLFDHTSKKLLLSMMVPLIAGGAMCSALLYHGGDFVYFICPTMLLFYGLALINSSKYTIHRIEILGYAQIILGIFACFYLGNGLLIWSVGFGAFHIFYGIFMWLKYDYKK